ncbi:MAG: hypothetical protein IJ568_07875 [Bacilli bacterium]|nr:hypothetical protein [Bacilli bacterium]
MSGIGSNDMTDEEMWQELYRFTGSKYASAAIMGNFWAETHITSNNAENKINRNTGLSDEEYTEAVDNGSYTSFVEDKGGYGLASWTYYTRKQALYDLAKETGCSIGSTKLQIYFLEQELSGHYSNVLENMQNADSLYDATVAFMRGYEGCGNQSEENRDVRTGFAENYLNLYRDLGMAEAALDLSDISLSIDFEQLDSICNTWASKVQSIDISAVDVTGAFSSLMTVEVATGYVPSLKSALQKAEELVLNTTKNLLITTDEQKTTDAEITQKNTTTSTGGNYYSGSSGGSHGSGESEVTHKASTKVDNAKKKVDINTVFKNEISKLDRNAFIGLMTALSNITSNFLQYLTNTDYATELKKYLLASPNLTDDLKKKILEMNAEEIQVTLMSILKEQKISLFSKEIITMYLNNNQSNYNQDKFLNNISSFKKVIDDLINDENTSEKMLKLYDGDLPIEDEKSELVKTIVDKLSDDNSISYEELLNGENNDALKTNLEYLSKDLSYYEVVNKLDTTTRNTIITESLK